MTSMSEEERSLVARTLSLYERIDLHRASPSSFSADEKASLRLASWKKAFDSLQDDDAFDRRLRFDGFDRTTILPVLGHLTLPDSLEAPAWLEIVRAVRAAMRDGTGTLASDLGEDVPFAPYWGPWLRVATARVAVWRSLHDDVRRELLRSLLRDLAQSGTQCLMREFDLVRVRGQSDNELFFARVQEMKAKAKGENPPTNERYLRFLSDLHGARAGELIVRYPCLARLAATRVLYWVRHITELFERLEHDRAELSARFGELGRVVGANADLGDAHNGGRQVTVLRFESGQSVVYKPKDLSTESAFQELAMAINALGFRAPLATLAVVARGGYGWVEYVPTKRCQDDSELRAYYLRCGALVALVTLLRGADCHFENIIANGDQPILIDHEVLLAPVSDPERADLPAIDALLVRLEASALRTGLLPQWSVELDGTVVDLSGIGARPSPRVNERLMIRGLNSDDMALEMTADVPILQPSASGSADLFEAEVIAGLQEVHRLLLDLAREKGRDALLDLFAPFDAITSRHVVRATTGYAYLLREIREPALMGDGLDRAVALDRIARTFLAAERPAAWAVVRVEHESLGSGDVPYFVLRSDSKAIFARDAQTGVLLKLGDDVFAETGIDAVKRMLRTLSDEDTVLESSLVAVSFSGKAAGVAAKSARTTGPSDRELEDRAFDEERAKEKALAIARHIAASGFTFRGDHHRAGLQYDEGSGTHHITVLGPQLYNGNGGIALFLAAAARIARDEDLRRAALDTLAVARAAIRHDPRSAIGTLGGFDGVGGVIYVLARLHALTGDEALLEDARRVVGAIAREDVDGSPTHDVFSGTAGLVLGLAALSKAAPRGAPAHADLIAHCARRIVAAAKPQASGIGWPIRPGEHALCGLAHGNAGIALALMEAWRAGGSREQSLRTAAEAAILYERSLRDDELGNWPDLRPDLPDGGPPMSAWCNGAPGILLARSRLLGVDDAFGGGSARDDFEVALRTTRAVRSPAVHLCCGTAGIDEILFEVGLRNDDAALTEVARRRMMARVEIDEMGRCPQLVGRGFMRGSAGVGFALLRMTTEGRALATVLDLSA
jgi:type 2 lantibiotic biosynthesis protein LanM